MAPAGLRSRHPASPRPPGLRDQGIVPVAGPKIVFWRNARTQLPHPNSVMIVRLEPFIEQATARTLLRPDENEDDDQTKRGRRCGQEFSALNSQKTITAQNVRFFAEKYNAVGVSPQVGERGSASATAMADKSRNGDGGPGHGEGGTGNGIRLRQGYGGQVGEWGTLQTPQTFQTFQTSQTSQPSMPCSSA